MGCGDWNDGMNKVGAGGKGESVWVAWFLLCTFDRFIPLVEARGDHERAAYYRAQAERLHRAIDDQAWDGRWYRRAYFDDGTPLGSAQNDECRIDSLAQSWAVIARGDTERSRLAMREVSDRLVRRDDKLILLFTPPFDKTAHDPGYIKGYLPGVRENGGQYTHAATWVVQAFALLGEGGQAMELFDLLNPVLHGDSGRAEANYKVEPYVVAADVYSLPPHTGRGGWTWYTGSAAWMYRVALESLLGFQLHGDRLRVQPCIPAAWPGFEVTYHRGNTTFHIVVDNPGRVQRGVRGVACDGRVLPDLEVPLAEEGGTHEVRVTMG
jgi:cyclic beta-1,2-glucan synthetase